MKFTVRFRGREITHPEKAQEQLDYVVRECEDIANVEVRPMMEARTMTLLIAPKPAIMQKVAQPKAAAEKARQQAMKEGRALPPEPEEEEPTSTTTTMMTTMTRTTTRTMRPSEARRRRAGGTAQGTLHAVQRRQSFLVLVGCAVAAAVSARALNAYVERRLVASTVGKLVQLGDFLPGESGAASPPAPPSPNAENVLAPEDIGSEPGTEEEPNETESGPFTHPHRHRDKRRARPQRNAHGTFVSRATVERLIRAGARPSGYPVEGSGPRPPGVIVREPAQLRGLLFPGAT